MIYFFIVAVYGAVVFFLLYLLQSSIKEEIEIEEEEGEYDPAAVVMTGQLFKLGSNELIRSWKMRTFKLIGLSLQYYEGEVLKGEFNISKCTVQTASADECKNRSCIYGFVIQGEKKMYVTAPTEQFRAKWIKAIRKQLRLALESEIDEPAAVTKPKTLAGSRRLSVWYNKRKSDPPAVLQPVAEEAELLDSPPTNSHGSLPKRSRGFMKGKKNEGQMSVWMAAYEANDGEEPLDTSSEKGTSDAVTYASFLQEDESIVFSSVIGHKNPVGIMYTRHLILTDTPKLMYFDPATMALKGEIDWLTETPHFEEVKMHN